MINGRDHKSGSKEKNSTHSKPLHALRMESQGPKPWAETPNSILESRQNKDGRSDRDAAGLIRLDHLVKDYAGPTGPIHVLRGVDLSVQQGEFVGIQGPSGSGKSTLLNMITGIDRPTAGQVSVAGQSLTGLSENKLARWRGENVGVIFQFFQLLPTLSVLENVVLPMDFARKWKPKERLRRAMMLLEHVELGDQAHKLPNALSGGQQQRAAIARALANDPPLLVGDEPTGNLDSKTADRIFRLFEELVDQGRTFLMVTHNKELASRIDRVIEVRDGQLTETNGRGPIG